MYTLAGFSNLLTHNMLKSGDDTTRPFLQGKKTAKHTRLIALTYSKGLDPALANFTFK
jgi:hypothetical protein